MYRLLRDKVVSALKYIEINMNHMNLQHLKESVKAVEQPACIKVAYVKYKSTETCIINCHKYF